jgi:hypothetical protein
MGSLLFVPTVPRRARDGFEIDDVVDQQREVNHAHSTAYFAGVATVFTATALGFGGALMITSATAPQSRTDCCA